MDLQHSAADGAHWKCEVELNMGRVLNYETIAGRYSDAEGSIYQRQGAKHRHIGIYIIVWQYVQKQYLLATKANANELLFRVCFVLQFF